VVPSALENILQAEKSAARGCCFLANLGKQTPPQSQPLRPRLLAGEIMGLSCNPSRSAANRKEMGGNLARAVRKKVD